MDRTTRRERGLRRCLLCLALVAAALANGRAGAQVFVGVTPYGPYFGFADTQASRMADYQTLLSLNRAHAAYAERNQAMGSLDNSNAYYNHLREPEFFERYDTTSRRSVEENAARRPSGVSRPAVPPTSARRADSSPRPLVDFFDRSGAARLAPQCPDRWGLARETSRE